MRTSPEAVVRRFAGPAPRRSLSDDVVDRLRAGIVRGSFEPGQRLTEAMLADAFDVSRGPVREALAQLAREGLVVFQRHKGATIARLSEEEIEQIYELRLALERLAMERAVRLATDEDLAAMDLVISSLEGSVRDRIDEVLDLDLRFHDLIYRAARHPRLYASWSNMRSQVHAFLFSRTTAANVDYLGLVAAEHAALLDAIRSRDKARALSLIEAHLREAYERMTREESGAREEQERRPT